MVRILQCIRRAFQRGFVSNRHMKQWLRTSVFTPVLEQSYICSLNLTAASYLHCTANTYAKRQPSKFPARKSYSQKFVDVIEDLDGKEDFYMQQTEWEEIEAAIHGEGAHLLHTLDYSMMKHLSTSKKPLLAQSFMDYIQSKRHLNTSAYLEYIDICFEMDVDKAFQMFVSIINGSQETLESVYTLKIARLCRRVLKTKYWKRSIPQAIQFYQRSQADIKSYLLEVLETSLMQKDYHMFYKFVKETGSGIFYDEMRDYLFQLLLDRRIPVDVFLELLKVGDCSLTIPQAQYLKDRCYRTKSFQAKFIYQIWDRCPNCQQEVHRDNLSAEHMDILSKQMYDNVVVSGNIYKNTTPKELSKFVKFVQQYGPFSCVIDGLNMGFLLNTSKENYKSEEWAQLYDGISKIVSGKILVVDRHGGRYTDLKLVEVRDNVFLCRHDFRSADDGFILLAAVMSGPECYYISRDLYRDHQNLVDPNVVNIFKDWLRKKRIHGWWYKGRVEVSTFVRAQETKKSWHVSVQDSDKNVLLCITKHNYQSSNELLHLRSCQALVNSATPDDAHL